MIEFRRKYQVVKDSWYQAPPSDARKYLSSFPLCSLFSSNVDNAWQPSLPVMAKPAIDIVPEGILTPDEVAEDVHPLHYAAAMGDKKNLIQILSENNKANTVFSRDSYGRTALIYAVVSGKQACAEILLKSGADVNSVDQVCDIASCCTPYFMG
jgi:ankyrin repeat protein